MVVRDGSGAMITVTLWGDVGDVRGHKKIEFDEVDEVGGGMGLSWWIDRVGIGLVAGCGRVQGSVVMRKRVKSGKWAGRTFLVLLAL